jgi:hypothetical protein
MEYLTPPATVLLRPLSCEELRSRHGTPASHLQSPKFSKNVSIGRTVIASIVLSCSCQSLANASTSTGFAFQ